MVRVIEIEHLKACPFCGGKAELRTDQHALNEAYNYYKVVCTECQTAGKTFLDGQTVGFENHPSRIVLPGEAIRKAVEAWNKRERDDKRAQAERERQVFYNSLSEDETAPMMEAVKLFRYANCEELRFCGNMARLYGCIPLESDRDNLLNFLCTLYHYGRLQGIRSERARRKQKQEAPIELLTDKEIHELVECGG